MRWFRRKRRVPTPLTMSDLDRESARRSAGWYRSQSKLLADLDEGRMTATEFVRLSRDQGMAKISPERTGSREPDVDTRSSV